jgi:hypothetical protein
LQNAHFLLSYPYIHHIISLTMNHTQTTIQASLTLTNRTAEPAPDTPAATQESCASAASADSSYAVLLKQLVGSILELRLEVEVADAVDIAVGAVAVAVAVAVVCKTVVLDIAADTAAVPVVAVQVVG